MSCEVWWYWWEEGIGGLVLDWGNGNSDPVWSLSMERLRPPQWLHAFCDWFSAVSVACRVRRLSYCQDRRKPVGIANELITRGWCQRALMNEQGAVCLLGAAKCADNPETEAAVLCAPLGPAVLQLDRLIGKQYGTNIADYNNAAERTYDEVLRVAKEVDEILDRNNAA